MVEKKPDIISNLAEYRPQRRDLEAAYIHMDLLLEERRDLTVGDVLDLHTLAATHSPNLLPDQIGEFRSNPMTIAASPWEVKPFAHPGTIRERVDAFLGNYNNALRFKPKNLLDTLHLVGRAASTLVDFEDIQPFAGRNGSLGRLFSGKLMEHNGLYDMPTWAPEVATWTPELQKQMYLFMVENARRGRNGLLLHFILNQQAISARQEVETLTNTQSRSIEKDSGYLKDRTDVAAVLNKAASSVEKDTMENIASYSLGWGEV